MGDVDRNPDYGFTRKERCNAPDILISSWVAATATTGRCGPRPSAIAVPPAPRMHPRGCRCFGDQDRLGQFEAVRHRAPAGHQPRCARAAASLSLPLPISIHRSDASRDLARSAAFSRWAAFLPITPRTVAILRGDLTRWPTMTWSSQPPILNGTRRVANVDLSEPGTVGAW